MLQANLLERYANSFQAVSLDDGGGATRSPGLARLAAAPPGEPGVVVDATAASATASPAPSRGSSSRMLQPSVLSIARRQLVSGFVIDDA